MDKDLSQIASWMEAAGIAEIELLSGGKTIHMRLGDTGQTVPVTTAPVEARRQFITSTGIGTLLLIHPLRKVPFADIGSTVKKCDVVGLLRVGLVYLPVTAPSDGVIAARVAEAGARLGFGEPIFELA